MDKKSYDQLEDCSFCTYYKAKTIGFANDLYEYCSRLDTKREQNTIVYMKKYAVRDGWRCKKFKIDEGEE